jgi:hypothetical protein
MSKKRKASRCVLCEHEAHQCQDCRNKVRRKENVTAEQWAHRQALDVASRKRAVAKRTPEQHRKKWQARNAGYFKWKYGITVEEKEAMFVAQGRCCACCGSKVPRTTKGRWQTDHDHKTKKVRAILCRVCNVVLGMVDENVVHLQALISYIERFKQ